MDLCSFDSSKTPKERHDRRSCLSAEDGQNRYFYEGKNSRPQGGPKPEPNEAGLQFYDKVFAELKKYGIEPLVTILHFDMPVHLATAYGGWANRKLIDFYLRYASTVFQRYRNKVKYWVTVNEVNVLGGYWTLGLSNDAASEAGSKKSYNQGETPDAEAGLKFQALHHLMVASALRAR